MVTITQFGRRLDPTWNGGYLPWVALLISFEAVFSRRITRHLAFPSYEWLAYRGAEVVMILLGLKVLLYILHGPGQIFSDFLLWRQDFFGSFFSGEYLLASLLIILIWVVSVQFAEDLDEMGGDESLLGEGIPVDIAVERMRTRRFLIDRVLFIGLFMVLMVALTRVDLALIWGERPAFRGSVLNLLVYFMLLFALLSQTQFSILRAGWSWERLPFSFNMGIRWTGYGIVFLLILVVIALILPTQYTLGLLTVLRYLIGLVLFAFALVWGLVLYFFSMLMKLLGLGLKSVTLPRVAPRIVQFLPTGDSAGRDYPWLELAKSLFFWVVFLGIVGYAIYQFLSQNRDLVERLRRLPGIAWLTKSWQLFTAWARNVNRAVAVVVDSSLSRLRRSGSTTSLVSAWRYANLRRMSPRERVLFYYLALVRRGGESGILRQPDQTPYEYQNQLRTNLPDVSNELDSFTSMFVEARYSKHDISVDQAARVQGWWESLRRALMRLRKKS